MRDYDYFANKKYKIVHKYFDEFDTDCDYDEVAIACHQAIELKLKYLVLLNNNEEVKTHKLTTLARKIESVYPNLKLIRSDLSLIQDYYFDRRYPGEDYEVTDLEEVKHAISILEEVFSIDKDVSVQSPNRVTRSSNVFSE